MIPRLAAGFGTGRWAKWLAEQLQQTNEELKEKAQLLAEQKTEVEQKNKEVEQAKQALEEAEVALFVIDAREGVTPLDEVFADLLRRRGKPVVLVANKTEGRAGDAGALEGFGLGFGEPVPV